MTGKLGPPHPDCCDRWCECALYEHVKQSETSTKHAVCLSVLNPDSGFKSHFKIGNGSVLR